MGILQSLHLPVMEHQMPTVNYQLMVRKSHSIYFNFIQHFSNGIQVNFIPTNIPTFN